MTTAGLVTAALAMFAGAPAFAADVPVKAAPLAAVNVSGPSRTGCYVGGNVGYGWQPFRVDDVTIVPNELNGDGTAKGVIGGGQIGCDHQVRNWVFGLQGMFDWAGIHGSDVNPAATTDTFGLKTDHVVTFTGRIGYQVEARNVVYLKGGAAWVHNNYTDKDPVSGGGYSGVASATRTGWTIGGGWEFGLLPGWSAFVEYDYAALGSHNVVLHYTGPGAPPGGVYTERFGENLQTVLVGINFHIVGMVQ